ncbi:MAG: HlyD family efflux transporter periplasmic adaptor subunit [Bryobacterales bacterium]|nr:HlyD family efflux transporter periplasmic adaptor subunit [Bryobacterales bacterium]
MSTMLIRVAAVTLAAALLAGGAYLAWQSVPEDESEFALAQVRRGDLVVKTYLRGELRAVRSLTLTAPNIGAMSQVTQLAPTGALANRGDLLFELDDSERVAALEDTLLEVEQIQENLKKAEAELEIRKSQDEVEIVQANFQVRRAELEVQRNELLADIDARKNELTLEEARRRKQKLEADIENRLRQREAELAVLREQLNKAMVDVDRDRRRIAESRVLSPLTGLVSIQQNRSGGRGGFGQSLPEIREGDQVYAGMPVVQLLDLSEMELMTRVEESERANLREGQEVLIRLDALSDKSVPGEIKRLGTTASANIFAGEATKKFECVIEIDMRSLLQSVGAEIERIERILATARQNAAVGYGAQRRGGQNSRQGATDSPAGGAEQAQAAGEGGQRERRAGGRGQDGQQLAQADGQARGQRGQGGGQRAQGGGQGGGQRGQGGGQDGGQRAQGGRQGGGQGGQGGGQRGQGFDPSRMLSRLPEEVRSQAEALLNDRSPQDLSDEERQQFRQIMQAARGGGGGQRQGGGGQRQGGGQGGFGGAPGGFGGAPGGFGGAPGGFGGTQGGGGGRQPAEPASDTNSSGFNEAERQQAQLPEPPQEGSDVDVLLRPGLLADAEVTVETIPNTLYIPNQAVFEEGAQVVVFVLDSGQLRPRRVELGRRSESQIAVVSGLQEGDMVSLYRPEDSGPPAPSQSAEPSGGPSFPGGGRSR